MGYLILIGIVILIIWGIIKLIIFLAPLIAKGALIVLVVGGVVGLVAGVFYGIRNYMLSIHENIDNTALKVTMIIITSLFIIIFFLYLAAVVYYLANYLN